MSKYTDSVEQNLEGLTAVSTGLCPGCGECADQCGLEPEEYEQAYEEGSVCDEGGFSWSGCGICGSTLGGTLYTWHGINSEGEILHFDDACTDCVMYLANGVEPEEENAD